MLAAKDCPKSVSDTLWILRDTLGPLSGPLCLRMSEELLAELEQPGEDLGRNVNCDSSKE